MGDIALDRDLLAFTLDDVAATVLSIEDGPANDDDALAFSLYFDDLGDRLVAFTVAASMRGDNDLLAQIDAAQTLLQGTRALLRRPRDGPPPLRRPPSPPIVPQPVVGRDLSPPLRSRGTSVDSSVSRRSRSPSSRASSRPSTRASSRSPLPTPSPSVRSALSPDHSLPSSRDVSRAPSPSPPPRTRSPSVDSSIRRQSRSASPLAASRYSTRSSLRSPLQAPLAGSPSSSVGSPNYSLPSSSNPSRAPSPSLSDSSRASDGYQSVNMNVCAACMTEFADDSPLRAPCDHAYDVDCMIEFFRTATTDDLHFPPRCCGREIPLYDVRDVLPDELVARYLHRADERAALLRVVCPDATCARILGLQTELQPYTTCPDCGVGVCTACRAAHEPGMTCAQHEDALPLADLARQQGWQRCTACRRYVQHAEGCWHMTCLCGTQFCYLCAARWKTCQCPQFAVPVEEGVPAPIAVAEEAEFVEVAEAIEI